LKIRDKVVHCVLEIKYYYCYILNILKEFMPIFYYRIAIYFSPWKLC